MSGFANAIIGGAEALIRKAMRSPNYVANSTGWTVNKDGSAEFNDVTVRGSVDVGTATQYVKVYDAPAPIDGPVVAFNQNVTNFPTDGYIRAITSGPGEAYGALEISSPEGPDQDAAQISLQSGDANTGVPVARNCGIGADLVVNGTLSIEPAAGNPVLQADDVNGTRVTGKLAVSGLINANGGIQLPPATYIKRGGLGTPVFQNGWTNFGSGFQAVRYLEYPDCTGGLIGVASGGTTTQGTALFTIPAALAPAADHTFGVPANNGKHAQIVVSNLGNVFITNVDTGVTWVSLSGIRWPISGF